jgi:AcrR family transcriptional regulator
MNNQPIPSLNLFAKAVEDAKRELLLRSASEEFAEKGLEGATMRGIATRAGCTTGAIYPLFRSKESIYAALLAQSLDRLDAHIASAVTSSDAPAAQVKAACGAFLDYYLRHKFEINLGLYAFNGLKRQGVGKDSNRALNKALEGALDRIGGPLAASRGIAVDSARPLVALLFSQMIGAVVLEVAGRLDIFGIDSPALLALMLEQVVPPTRALPSGEVATLVTKTGHICRPAKSEGRRR